MSLITPLFEERISLWLFSGLAILLFRYLWKRRFLYLAALQFKGGFALPFIGIGYMFVGSNEDVLDKIMKYLRKLQNKQNDPVKFWLGTKLIVAFLDPAHIEKIMISQKFAHKVDLYDFLKRFLGEGLVSASGPTYRKHKKMIVPYLNLDFVKDCYDIFQKCSQNYVTDLKRHCGKGTFNVYPITRRSIIRTISISFLGTDLDFEADKKFVKYSKEIYDVGFTRIVRPWLYPDVIFNRTELRRTEDNMMSDCLKFLRKTMDTSRNRISSGEILEDGDIHLVPFIDRLMAEVEKQPGSMSAKEFADHMFTIFLASEDTLTLVISFGLMCLGMYPECQEKVAAELRANFGETPKKVATEDVSKLKYLDMCVKETLRLVPIAPMVARNVLEDAEIDGWKLPKNSSVLVPVHFLHRDPQWWEKPEEFFPEHFLPETENLRPNYVYVPFSAGPRACVGKIFANMNLRLFMAQILQVFEIEADGKIADIKMMMDVTARPVGGCNIRIKRRIWK